MNIRLGGQRGVWEGARIEMLRQSPGIPSWAGGLQYIYMDLRSEVALDRITTMYEETQFEA